MVVRRLWSGFPTVFRDLETVRLIEDFATVDGTVPAGTEATILQVFGDGAAYQVEFEAPHTTPETVPAAYLESVGGRAA